MHNGKVLFDTLYHSLMFQTAPVVSEVNMRTNVELRFEYLGGGVKLMSVFDPRVYVEVHQQHCGGNNICLFKGKLLAKG